MLHQVKTTIVNDIHHENDRLVNKGIVLVGQHNFTAFYTVLELYISYIIFSLIRIRMDALIFAIVLSLLKIVLLKPLASRTSKTVTSF